MSFLPPGRTSSGYRGKQFKLWVLGQTNVDVPYETETQTIKKAVKRAVADNSSPGKPLDVFVLVHSKTQNGNVQEALFTVKRYPKEATFQTRKGRPPAKIMGWSISRIHKSQAFAELPESAFPESSGFRSLESRKVFLMDDDEAETVPDKVVQAIDDEEEGV